ncbi:transcriptional regulator, AraC family [Chitinophaga costaii]|uniref:Transcriptional regulator, AraC family n=1 Tax=Chitinophaga costaii TaxID=1335309 RepID=A0A1C3YS20_9BACT|nr:AraC family transcriptional regulator [Chitinophaga costaii]PUZ30081.1 AraC family transcriptional regulator [Chitinophaga costaii]SCB72915.1 transcriptional regulator, AraC family [Chitinophaga costaii]
MKILQFTLPVTDNQSIITKEETLSQFYPYLHRHHEIQLTWIIRGEGTLIADDAMHPFHDNEIYWISTNQSHVFKNDADSKTSGKRKTHSIDIFFNQHTQLGSFFSIPEVRHLKTFLQQHDTGFRIPDEAVKEISAKMLLVRNTSELEQFYHFIDLLKQIASLQQLKPLSSQPKATYNDYEGIRIATIYNYVMQHYQQTITLEEVSKLVYMTPPAFCRYFKKHTQHTLVSFINMVRINEACKKLVGNEHNSIAAVAYNTGFNSITNFNRVFKSIKNMSPKEYVDSYLNKLQIA